MESSKDSYGRSRRSRSQDRNKRSKSRDRHRSRSRDRRSRSRDRNKSVIRSRSRDRNNSNKRSRSRDKDRTSSVSTARPEVGNKVPVIHPSRSISSIPTVTTGAAPAPTSSKSGGVLPAFMKDMLLQRKKEEAKKLEEAKKIEEERKRIEDEKRIEEEIIRERMRIQTERLASGEYEYEQSLTPNNPEEDEDDYRVQFIPDYESDEIETTIAPVTVEDVEESDDTLVPYNAALMGCRNFSSCFEVLGSIDEGTYGVVYRAKDKATNDMVAVKKVKIHDTDINSGFPITSIREMNILLSIKHENIIRVREVAVGNRLSNVYMIMDFEDHDLKQLMSAMKFTFQLSEVKCLVKQLLEGVDVLHSNWIMHRDLKTSNLLYSNNGTLKICDFGMSRKYGIPLGRYTEVVCTLWYRAPEVLLGAVEYGPAVDMWSVGCLMAEFLTKQPLFPGQRELDQLDRIFRVCGTPKEDDWKDLSNLRFWKQFQFKNYKNKLRESFPRLNISGVSLSDVGFDLLRRLLEYDPTKRITAAEALKHPWFGEQPGPQVKDKMPKFASVNANDRIQERQQGIVKEATLGGGLFE